MFSTIRQFAVNLSGAIANGTVETDQVFADLDVDDVGMNDLLSVLGLQEASLSLLATALPQLERIKIKSTGSDKRVVSIPMTKQQPIAQW